MKYCPECEAEYFDTVEICADCDVPLISEQEYKGLQEEEARLKEMLKTETFVPIMTVENRFQADRAEEILGQNKIPVLVRQFHDTAYDGIFEKQKGWAHIEVPEHMIVKAKELVGHLGLDFEVPACACETGDEGTALACSECGVEVSADETVCPGCGEVLDAVD